MILLTESEIVKPFEQLTCSIFNVPSANMMKAGLLYKGGETTFLLEIPKKATFLMPFSKTFHNLLIISKITFQAKKRLIND